MIRSLRPSDVSQVVALHLRAFPKDLISALGADYLSQVFYPHFLKQAEAVALAAEDESGFLGYIVGSTDSRALNQALLRGAPAAHAKHAAKLALTEPARVGKILGAGLYLSGRPRPPYSAGLAYIAVDAKAQGKGVGRELGRAFLEELKRRGQRGCWVKTDADLKSSQAFYESLGFKRSEKSLAGTAQAVYEIAL